MGQSSSSPSSQSHPRITPLPDPNPNPEDPDPTDHTHSLPDDLLAAIFHLLPTSSRNTASLVCRRWLLLDSLHRHRLSLHSPSHLLPDLPRLLSRFPSLSKLSLKSPSRSPSLPDPALLLISQHCPLLTRLKLRACRSITDAGIISLSQNCALLKKLSFGNCAFGSSGINAVVKNCKVLEELSVKRLKLISDPIGLKGSDSLKVLCLKELYNGQCFAPLIAASKALRTLKVFRCAGDWDSVLVAAADSRSGIVEVHLEKMQVSDVGLGAIARCPKIEILHLVKTPECTDLGIVGVAESCRLLRKLHIDGWKVGRIGDVGLVAVAKNCLNLQELVLIGVNPTRVSLELLASNCEGLERLALCGSETVGDVELSCIAAKCNSLKKLCIKNCPVSDHAMEALASGCPSLVKVKVKKCRAVTFEGAEWLRVRRGSVSVNLDIVETEHADASASDGAQENGGDVVAPVNAPLPGLNQASSSRPTGRSASFKSRFNLLSRRNFVASTLRRWSSTNSRPN